MYFCKCTLVKQFTQQCFVSNVTIPSYIDEIRVLLLQQSIDMIQYHQLIPVIELLHAFNRFPYQFRI